MNNANLLREKGKISYVGWKDKGNNYKNRKK